MAESTQFVGIDLHQDSVTLAVLSDEAAQCSRVESMANEPARLKRFFQKVSKEGPVRACYEAGGCGYVRHLTVAVEGGLPPLPPGTPRDPDFASIASDPRFSPLAARLWR